MDTVSQDIASVRLFRQRDGTRGFAVRFADGGEHISTGFATVDALLERLKPLVVAWERMELDERVRVGADEVP